MPLRKPKPPPCAHQWTVVGATYQPPLHGLSSAQGLNDPGVMAFVKDQTFGFTNVTQRCTLCGWTDVKKHQGKVSVPGFSWEPDTKPGTQRTYRRGARASDIPGVG